MNVITFNQNSNNCVNFGGDFSTRIALRGKSCFKHFDNILHKSAQKTKLMAYYYKNSREIAATYGIKDALGIDAYRHTWTSADISYSKGHLVSKILGCLNDYLNFLCKIELANMDLWNNREGRKIAREAKIKRLKREELPDLVKNAFDSGSLIIDPYKDNREYKSIFFNLFKLLNNKINLAN
ncbi:MAG: hypothetical protein WCY19_08470 [Candidatus Gastranaerophilaceae bacterium]